MHVFASPSEGKTAQETGMATSAGPKRNVVEKTERQSGAKRLKKAG